MRKTSLTTPVTSFYINNKKKKIAPTAAESNCYL